MLDKAPLFPRSMDFIPMLDKTSDLVERGMLAAAERWQTSFSARHGAAVPLASSVPEKNAGALVETLA